MQHKANIELIIVFTLVLFFFNKALDAGNHISSAETDSLKAVLKSATNEKRAILLLRLAEINFHDSLFAFNKVNEARQVADKLGNPTYLVESFLTKSSILYKVGQSRRALIALDSAVLIAHNSHDKGLIAKVEFKKIKFLYEMKQTQEAIRMKSVLLRNMEFIQDRELLLDLFNLLGNLEESSGNLMEAYKYFRDGLKMCHPQKDKLQSASFNNSLGALCDAWGVYIKSLRHYQNALSLYKDLNNEGGIAGVENNIGLVYISLGKNETAIQHIEKSLDIYLEQSDLSRAASAYNNLGLCYKALKKYDKAMEYYQKALGILMTNHSRERYTIVYTNLGELYGDLGQYSLAINYLKQAVEFDRVAKDVIGLSRSLQGLGHVYVLQNQFDLADQTLREAELIMRKHNLKGDLVLTLQDLAQLAEKQGDFKASIELYRELISLKDSVSGEAVQKQLSWLQTEKNLMEKDKEIEILETEKGKKQTLLIEKQNQLRRLSFMQVGLIIAMILILIALVFLWYLLRKNRQANVMLRIKNHDMGQQQKRLEEAINKAQEVDRIKANFLATMSHELRTPLNGIIGFSEIIEMELRDEVYAPMAKTINLSGRRLLHTLNNLLDLSQVESNRLEVRYSIFRLAETILLKVNEHRIMAHEKGLNLVVQIDDPNIRISSDETLVERILHHVVDNAIKYTEMGSVLVHLSANETDEGYWAVIKVADTGIGIPYEDQEMIFSSFRQGSEGLGREYEGTGVGLSLCRSWLQLIGGRIDLQSEPDHGSTFSIWLPALWEARDSIFDLVNHRKSVVQSPNRNNSALPRVLLVEDEETNREFALYTLMKSFNVDVAANGFSAIKICEKNSYDAILMDINLGRDMDGVEAMKVIRNLDGYKNTPIAAITANALKGEKERLMAVGFQMYLSKPYSRTELLSLMENLLA